MRFGHSCAPAEGGLSQKRSRRESADPYYPARQTAAQRLVSACYRIPVESVHDSPDSFLARPGPWREGSRLAGEEPGTLLGMAHDDGADTGPGQHVHSGRVRALRRGGVVKDWLGAGQYLFGEGRRG